MFSTKLLRNLCLFRTVETSWELVSEFFWDEFVFGDILRRIFDALSGERVLMSYILIVVRIFFLDF